MSNAETFWNTYQKKLEDAVRNFPNDYPRGAEPVSFAKMVADRFRAADFSDINHDGRGFLLTCKELGIKHTRKAVKAYLEG